MTIRELLKMLDVSDLEDIKLDHELEFYVKTVNNKSVEVKLASVSTFYICPEIIINLEAYSHSNEVLTTDILTDEQKDYKNKYEKLLKTVNDSILLLEKGSETNGEI